MKRSVLVLAMLLSGFMPARAQGIAQYLECFGGNQTPCTSYIVFDAIVSKQVGGSIRNAEGEDASGNVIGKNSSTYAGLEIGQMWNRGLRHSIGGTVEYDRVDTGQGRLAVKARGRRWLTPWQTIDVSVGAVGETVFKPGWVQEDCGTCTESGYGLTADATYGHRLLGITVGGDVIRGYGHRMTSVRVGARAGGIFGLGAAAIAAAILGMGASAL